MIADQSQQIQVFKQSPPKTSDEKSKLNYIYNQLIKQVVQKETAFQNILKKHKDSQIKIKQQLFKQMLRFKLEQDEKLEKLEVNQQSGAVEGRLKEYEERIRSLEKLVQMSP